MRRNRPMGENERKAHFVINHEGRRPIFVPIIGTSLEDGSEIFFECIADAQRAGFHSACIIGCLQGKRKSAGGYYWRKAE